jgi:hypothetical protein
MDTNLTHGDDMPIDWLSETDWKDFEDPIVGTLIPDFFITYFGQVLLHVMAKKIHLGSVYKLWANTANNAVKKQDDILSVMEEIKSPESIKKYLHPTQDAKSLPLATMNGPFGTMTLVQSDDYPVAACVVGSYKLPLSQYTYICLVVACSFQQNYDFSQVLSQMVLLTYSPHQPHIS